MGTGSWYLSAPDGRRFNWAKDPTFRCPLNQAARELVDALEVDDAGAIARAAAVLDVHAADLANVLRRAHRYGGGQHRRRHQGKLTDRCEECGARMERLGFHCWITRPKTKKELSEGLSAVTRELNRAFFGHDGPAQVAVERSFYAQTKAAAERWARRELEQAKAAA